LYKGEVSCEGKDRSRGGLCLYTQKGKGPRLGKDGGKVGWVDQTVSVQVNAWNKEGGGRPQENSGTFPSGSWAWFKKKNRGGESVLSGRTVEDC